jgi:hypothetical protein
VISRRHKDRNDHDRDLLARETLEKHRIAVCSFWRQTPRRGRDISIWCRQTSINWNQVVFATSECLQASVYKRDLAVVDLVHPAAAHDFCMMTYRTKSR